MNDDWLLMKIDGETLNNFIAKLGECIKNYSVII
jgi:hypothetical protein